LATIALVALLGSCAAPPKLPPAVVVIAPPPPAPPPPLPKPPADWRDAAQTPGAWRWAMTAGRSTASFGMAGAAPLVTFACDKVQGQVLLARSGASTQAVPMSVSTTSLRRPLLSDPARGTSDWLAVALPSRDPLLDAIAFSRGRFALEAAGLETLYLPAWPEISRVIEDCR
jgi:hypothetical protein